MRRDKAFYLHHWGETYKEKGADAEYVGVKHWSKANQGKGHDDFWEFWGNHKGRFLATRDKCSQSQGTITDIIRKLCKLRVWNAYVKGSFWFEKMMVMIDKVIN